MNPAERMARLMSAFSRLVSLSPMQELAAAYAGVHERNEFAVAREEELAHAHVALCAHVDVAEHGNAHVVALGRERGVELVAECVSFEEIA